MPAPDYATEIAALESALAAGELKVESDGEQVWYKSASDILAQLNYFRLKAAAALSPMTRGSSVAVFDRD
jgi:hypothetical protein